MRQAVFDSRPLAGDRLIRFLATVAASIGCILVAACRDEHSEDPAPAVPVSVAVPVNYMTRDPSTNQSKSQERERTVVGQLYTPVGFNILLLEFNITPPPPTLFASTCTEFYLDEDSELSGYNCDGVQLMLREYGKRFRDSYMNNTVSDYERTLFYVYPLHTSGGIQRLGRSYANLDNYRQNSFVFKDEVANLLSEYRSYIPPITGVVMAHELGHTIPVSIPLTHIQYETSELYSDPALGVDNAEHDYGDLYCVMAAPITTNMVIKASTASAGGWRFCYYPNSLHCCWNKLRTSSPYNLPMK